MEDSVTQTATASSQSGEEKPCTMSGTEFGLADEFAADSISDVQM